MSPLVDLVVKVGGSLARTPDLARRLERHLARCKGRRLLIVPGGGPFADAVRAEYGRHTLSESAAHWMAILGMDQFAHLLADVLPEAVLVRSPDEIAAAVDAGALPVLAPYAWLSAEDPLPHAWSVTGDSIAAWVAGRLGAGTLVLLKSRSDRAGVDDYFPKALPAGIEWEVVIVEAGSAAPSA